MADVNVRRRGAVLEVEFNRPQRLNAGTWQMYEGLHEACLATASDDVRLLMVTGAGQRAFTAGTDISLFEGFGSGLDGVEYERRFGRIITALEDVAVPTVAVVDGACAGGGLVIAAACDVVLASSTASFGVPIARTVGNCLSINSCSLLSERIGPALVKDLLLRARFLSAAEALDAGLVSEIFEVAERDDCVDGLVAELLTGAPHTIWAAKAAIARLRRHQLPDDDDLIATVYGSRDFAIGVKSFLSKQQPSWTGH